MAAALFRWWGRRRQSGDESAMPASGTSAAPEAQDARAPDFPEPLADLAPTAVAERVSDYVRVQVRSGLHDGTELRRLTVQAAESEIEDPATADELARTVLSDELAQWHSDAAHWVGRTDPERLDRALARLRERGVLVLPALDDVDVLYEVTRIQGCPNGAVAYLVADVWNALDFDELPLRVLDPTGRRADRDDPVVVAVMDTLAEEGLLGVASKEPAREDRSDEGVRTGARRQPARADRSDEGVRTGARRQPAREDRSDEVSVLVALAWRRRPTA